MVDLTSMFLISTKALKKMAEDSEQDENEYLFLLLEMITGNQPGKEVREPIIK